MNRFPPRGETLDIRGTSVTVRELTFPQKTEWVKRVEADKDCAPYALLAMVIDPPVTEDELRQWASEVLEELSAVAQRLSGMLKEAPEKND